MPRAPHPSRDTRDARDPRRSPHRPSARLGSPYGLIALPVFAAACWGADRLWNAPDWGLIVYAGASALAFIVYAVDKVAAKTHMWRISELTLQALALACGWPGALAAQQLLRHKIAKPRFLLVFWLAALVNAGAFLFWCSPWSPRVVGAPRIDETAVDLTPVNLDLPDRAEPAASAALSASAPSPSRPASSPPQ